jgi:hypothetical protein
MVEALVTGLHVSEGEGKLVKNSSSQPGVHVPQGVLEELTRGT